MAEGYNETEYDKEQGDWNRSEEGEDNNGERNGKGGKWLINS